MADEPPSKDMFGEPFDPSKPKGRAPNRAILQLSALLQHHIAQSKAAATKSESTPPRKSLRNAILGVAGASALGLMTIFSASIKEAAIKLGGGYIIGTVKNATGIEPEKGIPGLSKPNEAPIETGSIKRDPNAEEEAQAIRQQNSCLRKKDKETQDANKALSNLKAEYQECLRQAPWYLLGPTAEQQCRAVADKIITAQDVLTTAMTKNCPKIVKRAK
jgi:hypothetical protein